MPCHTIDIPIRHPKAGRMTAEINRKLANLIKQGVIAEVNPAAAIVRVQHGELLTDWLPYVVPFAGGVSVHRAPSVGENCLVLSPSGETANGIVLCGLMSAQFPNPAQSADEAMIRFPDGGHIHYNHTSGVMTIKAVSKLIIDAPQTQITGHLSIDQTTTAKGQLTYQGGMSGSGGSGSAANISGSVTVSGDVVAGGISLTGHTHPDTTSGGNTGKPNP